MLLKKIRSFFLKDGWLTRQGDAVLTVISLVLIFVPLWLATEKQLNFKVAFALFCLGIILGAAVGYEGKAKQFGYQAPFTNDPLGWRKAKETYKTGDEAAKPLPQGIFTRLARWFKK